MGSVKFDCDSTVKPDGNVAEWFGALLFEAAEATATRLSEARVRIYANDLADCRPEDIVSAFRRVRKEGSGFFPSIAEIRRQIVATPDDAALLAWTLFERAAFDVGAYESIAVDDHCAATALLNVFGSWQGFCETEQGPEMALKRQQFIAAYRNARRETRVATAPKILHGVLNVSGTFEPKTIARLTAASEIVREDVSSVKRLTATKDGDE